MDEGQVERVVGEGWEGEGDQATQRCTIISRPLPDNYSSSLSSLSPRIHPPTSPHPPPSAHVTCSSNYVSSKGKCMRVVITKHDFITTPFSHNTVPFSFSVPFFSFSFSPRSVPRDPILFFATLIMRRSSFVSKIKVLCFRTCLLRGSALLHSSCFLWEKQHSYSPLRDAVKVHRAPLC